MAFRSASTSGHASPAPLAVISQRHLCGTILENLPGRPSDQSPEALLGGAVPAPAVPASGTCVYPRMHTDIYPKNIPRGVALAATGAYVEEGAVRDERKGIPFCPATARSEARRPRGGRRRNAALQWWERVDHAVRPHYSLGYLTRQQLPLQYAHGKVNNLALRVDTRIEETYNHATLKRLCTAFGVVASGASVS